jgi:hypothetical protein
VIVEGLQKARPGSPVVAVPAKVPAKTAAKSGEPAPPQPASPPPQKSAEPAQDTAVAKPAAR